jgi:DNA-binding transcriptional ArsR family regulator
MDADVAPTAAVLADPARVAMLWAVSDGRALAAGALARAGGVTASAASAHLSKLVAAGLLAVTPRGRHRWYRLANPRVVAALEALAALTPPAPIRLTAPTGLRLARTCYDHLAGALGVRITDVLVDRRILIPSGAQYALSASGEREFAALGIDVAAVTTAAGRTRRPLARACLDWSERRHHLAGALGAALATHLIDSEWMARTPAGRALTITPHGRRCFRQILGIVVDVSLRE